MRVHLPLPFQSGHLRRRAQGVRVRTPTHSSFALHATAKLFEYSLTTKWAAFYTTAAHSLAHTTISLSHSTHFSFKPTTTSPPKQRSQKLHKAHFAIFLNTDMHSLSLHAHFSLLQDIHHSVYTLASLHLAFLHVTNERASTCSSHKLLYFTLQLPILLHHTTISLRQAANFYSLAFIAGHCNQALHKQCFTRLTKSILLILKYKLSSFTQQAQASCYSKCICAFTPRRLALGLHSLHCFTRVTKAL